jgi:hypothetical protein
VLLRRRLSVLLAAVMMLGMTLASSSVVFAAHNENGHGQHRGGGDSAHSDQGKHKANGGGRANNPHSGPGPA